MRPGGDLSMIACVRLNVMQHALLLLGDAGLRVTGEVDERADDREHVVVLGERRAQREGSCAVPSGQ